MRRRNGRKYYPPPKYAPAEVGEDGRPIPASPSLEQSEEAFVETEEQRREREAEEEQEERERRVSVLPYL